MKKQFQFITVTLFLTSLTAYGQDNAFITTWHTGNAGTSSNTEITIPTFFPLYDYNYRIDWEEVNVPANKGTINGVTGSHTIDFGKVGTFRVEITGDFPCIYFNDAGDKDKILAVEQWGDIEWDYVARAFKGCTHLDITARDVPNLSGNVTSMNAMFERAQSLVGNEHFNRWDVSKVTNMRRMFWGATDFNQDMGGWNVSKVTRMDDMFRGATNFNQDIGGWNVGNVTNMQQMFNGATSFNQDIGGWNVSNVTNMKQMFHGASNFNQDIGRWNVSNVTDMVGVFSGASNFNQDIGDWNVSNVTNMRAMFRSAAHFNLDISGWNVSNVTRMDDMFREATSFNQYIGDWDVSNVTDMGVMFYQAINFNQDIGNWDISNVTDMEAMLDSSALSGANYGATLKGWEALPNTPTGITLGAAGLTYDCDGKEYRKELMNTHSWEFVGDVEGDDQAPVLTLITAELILYLDEGRATLGLDQLDYSAEDNCSEFEDLVYSFDAPGSMTTREFSFDDRGEHTVTLFVSDTSGNAASEDLAVLVVNTTDILSFSIPGQSGETVIDYRAQTIDLEMPFGTDLSLLSPTIGLSPGANSSPASNSVQDFTNTVSYTVTAADGITQQVWRVNVSLAAPGPSSDTDIISFTFAEQTGDAVIDDENHTVVIEVEFGTVLNGLVPTITLSDGASVNPESGVARNFTSQVSYTVTAGDGITKEIWTVTVLEDALATSSSPMIPTAFTPNGDGANDRWIIDNLSGDATIRIYDRHGTILFSSDNGYTRPWDGTSRGNSLPAGSYLYAIQDGPNIYKGAVTILL